MKFAGLELDTRKLKVKLGATFTSDLAVTAIIIGGADYCLDATQVPGRRSVQVTHAGRHTPNAIEGVFFHGSGVPRPETRYADAFRFEDAATVDINHAGILSGGLLHLHRAA